MLERYLLRCYNKKDVRSALLPQKWRYEMITNKYLIAEKVIEVTSLYNSVHDYCKDYVSDGSPDLIVKITQADIKYR